MMNFNPEGKDFNENYQISMPLTSKYENTSCLESNKQVPNTGIFDPSNEKLVEMIKHNIDKYQQKTDLKAKLPMGILDSKRETFTSGKSNNGGLMANNHEK